MGDNVKAYASISGSGAFELKEINIVEPSPATDQVLIRVHAVGVTPTELLWYPSTHKKDGSIRADAVPGHEFSGVVESVGSQVTGFVQGDAVFGMNDWFLEGATAELCVASEKDIVTKPTSISHTAAAATPIAALTGWQGLVEHGRMKAGDRVLIVGAGGSVGLMAVQIAVMHGCHVIASASSLQAATLKALGCEQVLDYKTQAFEDHVDGLDVVFDAVAFDTLARAKTLLKEGGRMVTIAADAESSDDRLIKESFFIVVPSHEQLSHIAQLIEQHELRVFVKGVLPLRAAPEAYATTGCAPTNLGKLVLFTDENLI
jgi:NADPH:quinone reductase-like Zn-dependent oxidoreductase